MGQYYDCVKEAVERYGGLVAKHTADSVLVYLIPAAHEDDAERAVACRACRNQAGRRAESHAVDEPLRARVGIATGLVVVGEMNGVDALPERAVIGETPHVATRLLGAGDPGTVVISSGTRRLIGKLFDLPRARPAGPDRYDGACRGVAGRARKRDCQPFRSPCGGARAADRVTRSWSCFGAAGIRRNPRGPGNPDLGEAGIGKSHLVAALQDGLKPERHSSLRYFCSPHRVQTALHPVIAQLEDAAGFVPEDSDDAKLDKLVRLLPLSSSDAAQDVALFAELLSIATVGRYAPLSISPQRRKEMFFDRFIAQLSGLAAHGPVLMVLEDAHWVDPTTRELFDVVIERARKLPVLFIMTYRPEFAPSAGPGACHCADLEPPGTAENNAALVRRIAGGKEFPPASRADPDADRRRAAVHRGSHQVGAGKRNPREEDGAYVLAGPLPVWPCRRPCRLR
jgi:hypothetical protein